MFAVRIRDDCELRLIEERHAPAVFACVEKHRDSLRQWLPWVDASTHVDFTRNFIRTSLARFAEECAVQAGIWVRDEFAGMIGYVGVDWLNHKTEIGYWLSPSYEGYGLMTDACRALIGHAFRELGLNRVEIRCATENWKSRAIPERLGFRQEGILRQAQWLHNSYVDLVLYSMLTSDWGSGQ